MTITISDGRGALWQWDTGRRVKIADGDGVKQVHYQNRCFGRSVDVDVGTDGTAIVPDELLQDWHPLTAYAYVTDDAGGYTKVQVDFAVHRRARPADYVYTPTEHAGFDKLRAEIGNLDSLTTEAKANLVEAINEAAASGGGGADWSQNDPDGDGYVANRPGGYTATELTDVFNDVLQKIAPIEPFAVALGDTVKVVIDEIEKEYTVVAEEVEGIALRCFGTDTYTNIASGAVTDGFVFATVTHDGVDESIEAAAGSYIGKTAVVTANVATPVVIPAKFLPPKESDVIAIRLEKTGNNYARCSISDYHKLNDAIDNGKEVILILSGGIDTANGWYRYSEHNDDGMHFVRITNYGGCYMHTLVNTGTNDNFAFFKVVESRTFVTTKFNDTPGSADEDGKMLVVNNGEWAKSDGKSITLKSSTEGSTKKFKLTIDDTGTLTATEVTTS